MIDDIINAKIYLRSPYKGTADRRKKEEDWNTKLECPEKEKSFLDEI